MTETIYPHEQHEIDEIVAKHGGTMPPLWAAFPGVHPYDICWRMGGGEAYKYLYWKWWSVFNANLTEEQRIEYFRKYPPDPCWLKVMIDQIWDIRPFELEDGPDSFDYTPYFKRTEELGFGSEADHERDMDDPKWLNGEDDAEKEDEK